MDFVLSFPLLIRRRSSSRA